MHHAAPWAPCLPTGSAESGPLPTSTSLHPRAHAAQPLHAHAAELSLTVIERPGIIQPGGKQQVRVDEPSTAAPHRMRNQLIAGLPYTLQTLSPARCNASMAGVMLAEARKRGSKAGATLPLKRTGSTKVDLGGAQFVQARRIE